MSIRGHTLSVRNPTAKTAAARARAHAAVFAALGDATRLSILNQLASGERQSISQIAEGSPLTRQAITKHLRTLERARLTRCVRSGRERLFELDTRAMQEARDYLTLISAQWDQALTRLKMFVETEDAGQIE